MNKSLIFVGSLVVAALSLLATVYYAMPGVNHILVSGDVPAADPQPKHVVLFLAIAVVCLIVALVTRPKRTASKKGW